ncbi:hypothetical protein GC163_18690 [bacterium]|nr:hypothetical protein [bacterium]
MPQKLVTIYLTNEAYAQGFFGTSPGAAAHGHVEEHLAAELAAGWRVVNVAGFGGYSDVVTVRGWFMVVLEKD